MRERIAGIHFRAGVVPYAHLRWRRGDGPPEIYVRTKHVRFRVALHDTSFEFVFVVFRAACKGEGGPQTRRVCWLREEWWQYEDSERGEWMEVRP